MQEPQSSPFATECDLVMKGGVTSGAVYPLAILEISKAFRFRSIGGTSSGAVAAAAAAAAELSRRRHPESKSFEELGGLPEYLASPSATKGRNRLFALFKPRDEVKFAFDALVRVLESRERSFSARTLAALYEIMRHHKLPAFLGFVVGVLPLFWVPLTPQTSLTWIFLAFLALLLAAFFACFVAVRTLLRVLPLNGYGLCSGYEGAQSADSPEVLTNWLAQYIDGLSGQASIKGLEQKPLTFGDLKATGVDLQMITTCLTLGRPFRLPFRDDELVRENNQFLFRKDDFDKLFPPYVVEWLVGHQRPFNDSHSKDWEQIDLTGCYFLPQPDDMPVVVATRMSLSFPLLLSAVPLYSVDFSREKPSLERCWFTDGGVGSNFPIHFFDAPLPLRPTFGIDLGHTQDPTAKRVIFAESNSSSPNHWRRLRNSEGLGSIGAFLLLVLSVAKDWNHDSLSMQPGFRDRIGLVLLDKFEGGLNLHMEKRVIERLAAYGREVGRQFVRHYGDPQKWQVGATASPVDWANHQSIRLRILLATVAEMVFALRKGVGDLAGTSQDYVRFFDPSVVCSYDLDGRSDPGVSGKDGWHKTQAGLAKWFLDELMVIATRAESTNQARPATTLNRGAPRPLPELRARPRV